MVASLSATLRTKLISSVILRRHADDFVVSGAPAHLSAQRLHFPSEAGSFKSVLDGDMQFFEIERFAYKIVGSQLERAFDVIELRVAGYHDDRTRITRFSSIVPGLVGRSGRAGEHPIGPSRVIPIVLSEGLAPRQRPRSHLISPFLALLA